MTRPLRVVAVVLALLALSLSLVLLDAHARRGRGREETVRLAVSVSGGPDLALSSSSRWLRHPIESEPAAAFADAPASLDVDPGSILISPPRIQKEGE